MNTSTNFSIIQANWQFVLPPARPSILEIKRIELLLTEIDRAKNIAILGSTIEFRNLVHKMGFQKVYILENNLDFYEISKSWITHGVENEILVLGNWLDTLKRYHGFFDVILSDETMGFIDYNNRKDFYGLIFYSLKKDGLFIDKELTHPCRHIPIPIIMNRYKETPINLITINRFCCEALFCSSLLDNEIVDTTMFYDILFNTYGSDPILYKYIELAHLVIPDNCIWFYGKYWNEIKDDYKQNYSNVLVYEDEKNSPYYGRVKHFINKK